MTENIREFYVLLAIHKCFIHRRIFYLLHFYDTFVTDTNVLRIANELHTYE